MRPLLLSLLLGALAPACEAPPEESAPDRWHVEGAFVRDPSGRAVILRGANVSDEHKRPPYFDFHELADYRRMREAWGMNSVRFLLQWSAIEPEPGVYDEAYLDEVARRVRWMEEAGLLVILDMHQDLYGEGFGGDGAPSWTCDSQYYEAYEPTSPWFLNYANENIVACYDQLWSDEELLEHYVEAWRRVAARVGDSPAVLGVDPMNEPYWGSMPPGEFEETVLSDLYEDVIAAVRAHAPAWLAFIEPASSRNLGIATRLRTPTFDGAVYAPHSYDGQAEAGEGFEPEKRDDVIGNIRLLQSEAEWLGAALWIGEYGSRSGDAGVVAYMDAQYDGAAAVAASAAYWHYGRDDGYGLLHPDGTEKTELLGAVARPYPARIAGDPIDFAYDEASGELVVRYRADRSIAAPTEIALPERLYPDGAEVTCGGCELERLGGRIRITAPPAGDPARVTVRPR